MIKKAALEHLGGKYIYRFNNSKASNLCNGFSQLNNYLNEMITKCPNEYFNTSLRGSGLKFKLSNLDLKLIKGHEISDLALQGLKFNEKRFNNSHTKIQVFMLENDDKTIAIEIPTWIYPKEINNFIKIFKSKTPLTGHIDILRVEDDKIWIWDYKPNAFQEKYAATQVYFYALMLSHRTNMDLSKFRCGYFDSNYAYVFKPELRLLENKPLIEFL